MPDFWKELPEEKKGLWTTSYIMYYFTSVESSRKGKYESLQKAYLKARWRAMWADFWDGTERGINWQVSKWKEDQY